MSDTTLLTALRQHFGFDAFRPGQADAIQQVVGGRDSLVVMPTGAGKSLCYQLPALLHAGTTVVVSPLIALMKDQVDALQANGVAATFINSSLDASEQAARLDGLRRGQWKLCYVAPERLRNQAFCSAVGAASVAMLAVDEAHCISQWGHDFRPDYLAIGDFVAALGRPPIVALTATATPQVQADIEQRLGLQRPFRQVTGFNRPNLRLTTRFTPGETGKQQELKRFLDEQPADACGVVYVGRRREAADVASFLRDVCGRSTVFYHGGLPGWERDTVQDAWMTGKAGIVVATNAFGMGVDKANVRFVVHYTLPGTVEAYYQEAGRAGRDGDAAECLLLSDPGDARLHEWFIENDAPSLEELRELFREARGQARRNGGRLVTTPAHLGTVLAWRGAETKVRVGLKLLEEAGLLEERGEQNGVGTWRLLEPSGRVDMEGPMRGVFERRALKRRLLQTMLDYAGTHECRRQYLLDYFGDATPPLAEWCCDNCQRPVNTSTRVASTPDEKAALWVLDAVHNLSFGVGRALLSKLLVGSRGGGMERYFGHPQFGILRHLGQKEAQGLVDELIRERYLRIEAGQFPTLALTPSGEQAVARRLAVPLRTTISSQPAFGVRPAPATRVTDTMEATRLLLEEGETPDRIAAARGLTLSTVFSHLAELIAQGKVTVERVVPEETRALVEAAVREVGSFYLSPIKARLPEEISYNEIRCVVAAMRRAGVSAEAVPTAVQSDARLERLMAWRRERAAELNQPTFFICSNTVLAAIAAAAPRTLEELEAVRGIGPGKVAEFGTDLLALLAAEGSFS